MSATSFIQATSTKLALATVFAASLVACGGSDYVPPATTTLAGPVAVGVSTTTVAAATAALVAAGTVTFPAAVSELETTAPTTLTFSAPAAGTTAVPFTMASGGVTSKGNLTFGSCIFTITEQPVGTVLTPFKVYTIPTAQCQLNVGSAGAKASGTTQTSSFTYLIGTSTSSPASLPVVIASDGTISVGGVTVGKGTLVAKTGGTSAP